jgi:hypothetical protein
MTVNSGSFKAYSREEAIAKFFEKTIPEPNSGCLLWTGKASPLGYGVYRRMHKAVFAHRWIFGELRGSIPDGLVVCHRCDTPGCVNVDHLFLGSQVDNIRDAQRKGRLKRKPRTICKAGHSLTGENLFIGHTARGVVVRGCRECRRQRTLFDGARRTARRRARKLVAALSEQ